MIKNSAQKKKNPEEEYEKFSSNMSDSSEGGSKPNIKEKYSAERLMMMLDRKKLEALEEEFNFD